MLDDVGDQPAVEAAGQRHLDPRLAQPADRFLGALDRGAAAGRQKVPQVLFEDLERRRATLRGVIRRITARRKFGEEGELVRAALRRQLLFGERDRTFGKSRVIGRQYRAVVAQRRAHQIGHDQ